ncbi:MAG: hypothetical protein LXA50_22815 [Betaproteobacteria bacterium]|jgi:hypothetical protein|nr:hypothetical protein [Betaproteobacteria bacterium]
MLSMSWNPVSRGIAVAAVALAAVLASPVQAATVMAPGSSWFYTFSNPTGNASWTTQFNTLGWLTGNAPFSNVTTGVFRYDTGGTFWPAGGPISSDDLWIGRVVDFSGFDTASAQWNIGIDNGYKLYVNGTLISQANAEGFTSRWEYTGGFPALAAGQNFIALALEDHGGLTAFDMEITARSTVIPLPAAGWLLLGGLGLLGWQGRRRSAAA